jgi:RimJ/RimL family protein N-acetyltransferase
MRLRWPFRRKVRIETPRFEMRTMTRGEIARASHAWTNDKEVMEALQIEARPWKLRRWRRRFARFDDRKNFCFGVWVRDGNRFIGYHTVQIQGDGVAAVGVVIGDKAWWGQSTVAETRSAIIDFLFQNKKVRRVWGLPFARNFPSIYNYQRLGFTYEGTLRRHSRSDFGEGADVLVFGMLKDEWAARKTVAKQGQDEQ